jgi:hypothetical protein
MRRRDLIKVISERFHVTRYGRHNGAPREISYDALKERVVRTISRKRSLISSPIVALLFDAIAHKDRGGDRLPRVFATDVSENASNLGLAR